jgi:uncharacterized RDD family membrane protein YckC
VSPRGTEKPAPDAEEYAAAPEPTYPEAGPGSVATFGARLLAFFIDGALVNVLAVIVNGGHDRSSYYTTSVLVGFLLVEIVFVTLAGQTPGMRVAGIAVVREADRGRPFIGWVLLRTFLLALVAPALVIDTSGRAMHDRASGTVMLRTR